jgi:eukaryotic-like serine/threonine-protein kinase
LRRAFVRGIALAAATPPPLDRESVLEQGTVVDGRYRLDQVLGQGAMGTVYRGEHLAVGRPIALKVLSHELSSSSTFRTRFRAEARAASAAGHPNIIEVFDAGELPDGRPYLVMELLHGRELFAELRDHGPMAPERACWIIREVARALHAAHEVGIIHRDLKAENIFLVDRDGADGVKVLDFGIAHGGVEGQRVTTPGLAMGTPEYMAPEQAYGAEARPTFDIYALGVLLFELLVGEPPFVADNPIEILGKKSSNAAPSLQTRREGLPEALVELVDECLALDPEDRPKTADEVARRLDAIRLAVVAVPRSVDARSLLDKRVVLAAVGFLILSVVGIAWMYGLTDDDEEPSASLVVAAPTPAPEQKSRPLPSPAATVEETDETHETGETEETRDAEPAVGTSTHGGTSDANTEVPDEPRVHDAPAKPKRGRRLETRSGTAGDKAEGTRPSVDTDSATCQLRRRQAHEARGTQDWEGVLRHTSSATCWSSARERDKLRVKAYMETLRFDRCVRVGTASMDPEVQRWVSLCEKRMQ